MRHHLPPCSPSVVDKRAAVVGARIFFEWLRSLSSLPHTHELTSWCAAVCIRCAACRQWGKGGEKMWGVGGRAVCSCGSATGEPPAGCVCGVLVSGCGRQAVCSAASVWGPCFYQPLLCCPQAVGARRQWAREAGGALCSCSAATGEAPAGCLLGVACWPGCCCGDCARDTQGHAQSLRYRLWCAVTRRPTTARPSCLGAFLIPVAGPPLAWHCLQLCATRTDATGKWGQRQLDNEAAAATAALLHVQGLHAACLPVVLPCCAERRGSCCACPANVTACCCPCQQRQLVWLR
jgi:hypothetical protein